MKTTTLPIGAGTGIGSPQDLPLQQLSVTSQVQNLPMQLSDAQKPKAGFVMQALQGFLGVAEDTLGKQVSKQITEEQQAEEQKRKAQQTLHDDFMGMQAADTMTKQMEEWQKDPEAFRKMDLQAGLRGLGQKIEGTLGTNPVAMRHAVSTYETLLAKGQEAQSKLNTQVLHDQAYTRMQRSFISDGTDGAKAGVLRPNTNSEDLMATFQLNRAAGIPDAQTATWALGVARMAAANGDGRVFDMLVQPQAGLNGLSVAQLMEKQGMRFQDEIINGRKAFQEGQQRAADKELEAESQRIQFDFKQRIATDPASVNDEDVIKAGMTQSHMLSTLGDLYDAQRKMVPTVSGDAILKTGNLNNVNATPEQRTQYIDGFVTSQLAENKANGINTWSDDRAMDTMFSVLAQNSAHSKRLKDMLGGGLDMAAVNPNTKEPNPEYVNRYQAWSFLHRNNKDNLAAQYFSAEEQWHYERVQAKLENSQVTPESIAKAGNEELTTRSVKDLKREQEVFGSVANDVVEKSWASWKESDRLGASATFGFRADMHQKSLHDDIALDITRRAIQQGERDPARIQEKVQKELKERLQDDGTGSYIEVARGQQFKDTRVITSTKEAGAYYLNKATPGLNAKPEELHMERQYDGRWVVMRNDEVVTIPGGAPFIVSQDNMERIHAAVAGKDTGHFEKAKNAIAAHLQTAGFKGPTAAVFDFIAGGAKGLNAYYDSKADLSRVKAEAAAKLVDTSQFLRKSNAKDALEKKLSPATANSARDALDSGDLIMSGITAQEGVRLETYKDTKGNDTVGLGYNFAARKPEQIARDAEESGIGARKMELVRQGKAKLTQEEAFNLYRVTIPSYINTAEKAWTEAGGKTSFNDIPEHIRAGVVMMAYNTGGNSQMFKDVVYSLAHGQAEEAQQRITGYKGMTDHAKRSALTMMSGKTTWLQHLDTPQSQVAQMVSATNTKPTPPQPLSKLFKGKQQQAKGALPEAIVPGDQLPGLPQA